MFLNTFFCVNFDQRRAVYQAPQALLYFDRSPLLILAGLSVSVFHPMQLKDMVHSHRILKSVKLCFIFIWAKS
jgi:hypothetical protein